MTMPASHAHTATRAPAKARGHHLARAGSAEDIAVLTLDEHGTILDCSRAAEWLFRYRRSELVWQHVSMLLPQLARVALMQDGQPNPDLRFRCRIGHLFRTVAQGGETFSSELYFTALSSDGHRRLLLIVRPIMETLGDEGGEDAA